MAIDSFLDTLFEKQMTNMVLFELENANNSFRSEKQYQYRDEFINSLSEKQAMAYSVYLLSQANADVVEMNVRLSKTIDYCSRNSS